MLRSVKDLRGYGIYATDGEIGKVHEFYFDDSSWTIRYLVVETGSWLSGRKVLIAPAALGQPDWGTQLLPVGLTKEQVENSPSIDLDKPVSRQMETELHTYYRWTPYWRLSTTPLVDPHLRSTREVIGYHIRASDGEIGHVEDFVADDETWIMHYVVVDTRNWLPGRKVLVAPAWIEGVDWARRQVRVDLLRETIKNSPEFDPAAPVNREYESRLYDYYGRPRYWV